EGNPEDAAPGYRRSPPDREHRSFIGPERSQRALMTNSESHETRDSPSGQVRAGGPAEGRPQDAPRLPLDESGQPDPVEGGEELGKYVYCIIETDERLNLGPLGIGEGENPVYTVHYRDLAAVVSDTPLRLYDPTREHLLAHELVNDTVIRDHTVIPMSF